MRSYKGQGELRSRGNRCSFLSCSWKQRPRKDSSSSGAVFPLSLLNSSSLEGCVIQVSGLTAMTGKARSQASGEVFQRHSPTS